MDPPEAWPDGILAARARALSGEPDLPCDVFAVDPRLANESSSMPCPYGFGRYSCTVKWPWGLQIERLRASAAKTAIGIAVCLSMHV